MTLSRVLDVVADRVNATVPGLASVGAVEPTDAAGRPGLGVGEGREQVAVAGADLVLASVLARGT